MYSTAPWAVFQNSPCAVATNQQNDIAQTIDFQVVPNPAYNNIHIVVNYDDFAPKTLQVVNLLGQVLREYHFNTNDFSVNIADLPRNIYLLQLRCGAAFSVQNLLKQ